LRREGRGAGKAGTVAADDGIRHQLADQCNQLRFAFQRGEKLFKRLQQGDPVLTQHVDLGALAAGEFLQILAFGAAEGGTLLFALVGDLNGDLGLHQPRLFVGGGAGLFGFDAFLLGVCLPLVGDRQLVSELDAQARHQEFRRIAGSPRRISRISTPALLPSTLICASMVCSSASRFSMRSSTRVGRTV
jgi:hypothetical protein